MENEFDVFAEFDVLKAAPVAGLLATVRDLAERELEVVCQRDDVDPRPAFTLMHDIEALLRPRAAHNAMH